MSGDELLKKHSDVVKDLDRLEEKIEDYRTRILSASTTQISKIRSRGGKVSDPTGEAVVKLEELECERLDLIGEKWDLRMTIFRMLMMMDNADHSRLMFLRYWKGMTFREISEDMGLTMGYLFKIKKDAITDFNRICQEESGSRKM